MIRITLDLRVRAAHLDHIFWVPCVPFPHFKAITLDNSRPCTSARFECCIRQHTGHEAIKEGVPGMPRGPKANAPCSTVSILSFLFSPAGPNSSECRPSSHELLLLRIRPNSSCRQAICEVLSKARWLNHACNLGSTKCEPDCANGICERQLHARMGMFRYLKELKDCRMSRALHVR